MRKLYQCFPISGTLSHLLTWSHYYEILKADKSSLFERLALSKDKEGVLKLAKEGHLVETAEDLMKDPFVLEFLNIPEQNRFLERELEDKIISNLQQFIMEMGKGFAFILSVGNTV
jgi:predicted nuclease of restriction endonuclease-like (RecB) superfamily